MSSEDISAQDQQDKSPEAAALKRAKRQADFSVSSIPVVGAPLAGVVGDLSFGQLGYSNPNDIFLALGSPVSSLVRKIILR